MPDNDTVQHEKDNIIDIEIARKAEEQRKQSQRPKHPPMINLPPVTKTMLLIIVGVQLVTTFLLSPPLQADLLLTFGFKPLDWTGQFGADPLAFVTPLTYMALHGGWMHLAMNAAMLMAFGAGCEKWMGGKRFTLFFVLCGIFAAVAEVIAHPYSANPIIGASGALSGLFAAALIGLQKQGRLPVTRFGIWTFAAVWVGISLVFGFFGDALVGSPIAWIAHLGGFFAGLALMQLRYFKFH